MDAGKAIQSSRTSQGGDWDEMALTYRAFMHTDIFRRAYTLHYCSH
jgi:hypothetical protein